ncbi:hypothetical protein D3C71_1585530 [compost metagenome]
MLGVVFLRCNHGHMLAQLLCQHLLLCGGGQERAAVRTAGHGGDCQDGRQQQAQHGGEGPGDAQQALPQAQGDL